MRTLRLFIRRASCNPPECFNKHYTCPAEADGHTNHLYAVRSQTEHK